MRIKSTPSNKGFSAIELLLVLGVIALATHMSINLTNSWLNLASARTASSDAYSYSKAVSRYITSHQFSLINLLNQNSDSAEKLVATLSPQVLVNEGYISDLVSTTNNLKQKPCTIIFYQNNQLQTFVYYRDDGNSKQLDQRQLKDGLNNMGSIIGLYQNESVVGAAKDWFLDKSQVNSLFVVRGSADISNGVDPELYYCSGSQIANNSYVVNVTQMLELDNKLPNDNTIHQFSDPLHDITDQNNNNQMNTDLNMDYTNQKGERTQSNIIFQNNPNCEMDPSKPETMEDYSSSNPNGCKNRQLGLQVGADLNGGKKLTVTGFVQGGVNAGSPSAPYVGAVSAASLQPTTKTPVGSACLQSEIGKIAQQKPSGDPSDINNIYVSQVICMKSPTCPAETGGFCYLPVQNVTINFTPFDKPATYSCPAGMFITEVQSNVQEYPDWGTKCCNITCTGHSSSHDHIWEGYTLYNDSQQLGSVYANNANVDGSSQVNNPLYIPPVIYSFGDSNILFPNKISLGGVKYASTCDAVCVCPPYVRPPWQPGVKSMTCSNDPSEASIIEQK